MSSIFNSARIALELAAETCRSSSAMPRAAIRCSRKCLDAFSGSSIKADAAATTDGPSTVRGTLSVRIPAMMGFSQAVPTYHSQRVLLLALLTGHRQAMETRQVEAGASQPVALSLMIVEYVGSSSPTHRRRRPLSWRACWSAVAKDLFEMPFSSAHRIHSTGRWRGSDPPAHAAGRTNTGGRERRLLP